MCTSLRRGSKYFRFSSAVLESLPGGAVWSSCCHQWFKRSGGSASTLVARCPVLLDLARVAAKRRFQCLLALRRSAFPPRRRARKDAMASYARNACFSDTNIATFSISSIATMASTASRSCAAAQSMTSLLSQTRRSISKSIDASRRSRCSRPRAATDFEKSQRRRRWPPPQRTALLKAMPHLSLRERRALLFYSKETK